MSMVVYPIFTFRDKTQWRTAIKYICPIFTKKEQRLIEDEIVNIVYYARCAVIWILSLPFGSVRTFKRFTLSVQKIHCVL